jgi:outer membrane immunogenic protein
MARLLSRVVAVAFVSVFGAGAEVHAQSYEWTGLYGGVTLGGSVYHLGSTTSASCPAGGYFCTPASTANASSIASTASGSSSGSAFIGSGAVGFNWQYGDLIFGPEADAGYFNLHGTRQFSAKYLAAVPAPPVGGAKSYLFTQEFSTDWLITARGRVGYTVIPAVIVYVTAGLAATDFTVQNAFSDASGASESASVTNHIGWTAGAGTEVALTQNWSLKAEYLFLDLGSLSVTGTVTNPAGLSNGLTTASAVQTHILRAGFNYRF